VVAGISEPDLTRATPVNYLAPIFLGSASFAFLNFSLPIYTRSLGADAMAIGGMYTAFTLSMLLIRPMVGWGLDRFGRRWFYLAAFCFYTLAMFAFSSATTIVDFYVARGLQGIGAALMWVSVRTIAGDLAAVAERGRQMGRITAQSVRGSMVGAFFGFTLLGMMPVAQAWSIAFTGYAIAAAVGFVLAFFSVRETSTSRSDERADREIQWPPGYWRLLLIVFISAFAAALIEPVYLIYLSDRFDLSMLVLAAAFFPAGLVYAFAPVYGGAWSDRLGRVPVIVTGMVIAALVSASLPWLPGIVWVAVAYTITALGWSMANPATDGLLTDMSSERTRGRLFGYKETAASLGASLGPLIGGAVYDYMSEDLAFALNAGVLLIGAGLAALLLNRSSR
jgi:MFS family permease